MRTIDQSIEQCLSVSQSKRGRLAVKANWIIVATVCSTFVMVLTPARADSIAQSLALTYSTNPQLSAERARLRSVDEQLAIAQSGYRPTVNGAADVTYTNQQTSPSSAGDGPNVSKGYSVTLNQPLYSGGRTKASVSEADATIRSNRENLRAIENSVLFDAVTAHMNVIRDRALVRVNDANIEVLERQLQQSQARFTAGELTKTDVEQARASLAAGQSALELARGNLQASEAFYLQVVGKPANGIKDARPPERMLPRSLKDAIATAIEEAPTVLANAYAEQASLHSVDRIFSQLLPQVDLTASFSDRLDPSPFVDRSTTTTITTQVTIPIYDAGSVRAQVRQAKELRQGRLYDIAQAREVARQSVVAAWASLTSTRAQITSQQIQVEASQTALTGVRAEEQVGQRTQLDILDAEQTLLNARTNLISSRRDLVVNAYRVIAATGRLTATDLSLGVEPYDVELHYSETNGRAWGIRIEREEGYAGALPPAP
jgi:outer membrane protein